MEFNNSGKGKCVLLKENNSSYCLIYALQSNEFIVASDLDKETGSWLHGHYFESDLDSALNFYNERVKESDLER